MAVKTRSLRAWMARRGIKNRDVANGAGVHPSYVSHFVAGRHVNSPAIREWLLGQGCPKKYLGKADGIDHK